MTKKIEAEYHIGVVGWWGTLHRKAIERLNEDETGKIIDEIAQPISSLIERLGLVCPFGILPNAAVIHVESESVQLSDAFAYINNKIIDRLDGKISRVEYEKRGRHEWDNNRVKLDFLYQFILDAQPERSTDGVSRQISERYKNTLITHINCG